jgi:hypothetical protein
VGSLGRLLWRWVDYPEVLALEFPSALRTVRELLPVGVARFEIIEENPQVTASDPPELPLQIMTLPAWATHHDHPLTSSEVLCCGLYPVSQGLLGSDRPPFGRRVTTSEP